MVASGAPLLEVDVQVHVALHRRLGGHVRVHAGALDLQATAVPREDGLVRRTGEAVLQQRGGVWRWMNPRRGGVWRRWRSRPGREHGTAKRWKPSSGALQTDMRHSV